MKHMATYLLLVLGGNASPSKDDVKKAMAEVGLEADDERLTKFLAEVEGKDLTELLEQGKEQLAQFGSGGGGGGGDAGAAGGDAGAAAEEEKVEEEEEAEAPVVDMFGGGDDGDY